MQYFAFVFRISVSSTHFSRKFKHVFHNNAGVFSGWAQWLILPKITAYPQIKVRELLNNLVEKNRRLLYATSYCSIMWFNIFCFV